MGNGLALPISLIHMCYFLAKSEGNATAGDDTLYPRPRLPPISFPNASSFTVYSSTQNLPAILNDPRLLKRQTDFFTKTWGEDFVPQEVPSLTLLPNIPKIYFDDYLKKIEFVSCFHFYYINVSHYCPYKRPCQGGSLVTRLNFKMSRVGVYKCLSLTVGFAITVTIWQRQVVSCRDFILRAVATSWAMSLVGIYPGRASYKSNQ